MKTRIPFCLVLLFPVCHAQCGLNVPDQQLLNALNEAGLISESDPSKFTLQDLTYLCFVRSSTDNTRFDQVRVSMLYTFDSATVRSAQVTFSLCLSDSFRFTSGNTYTVTQDPHLSKNVTREDCQDCLDNSTFARPTFCRRKHCYIEKEEGKVQRIPYSFIARPALVQRADFSYLSSGWPLWCSPMCQWWDLQSYWSDWLLMCMSRKLGRSNMQWWDYLCLSLFYLTAVATCLDPNAHFFNYMTGHIDWLSSIKL